MNNVDRLILVFADIDRIVSGLSRKTIKAADRELRNIISTWGQEAESYLLRCLLSRIDISQDTRGQPKDTVQAQLLAQLFSDWSNKPGFLSSVCDAFDHHLVRYSKQAKRGSLSKQSPGYLGAVCRALKFSRAQEVLLALSLLQSSVSETRSQAAVYLTRKFPELLESYLAPEAGKDIGLRDCETVHFICSYLLKDSEKFSINPQLRDRFLGVIRKEFPEPQTPIILSSTLYSDHHSLDNFALDITADRLQTNPAMLRPITGSLALQIQEIGYGFTTSIEECKHHLATLGTTEITPSMVAHVLSMMVRTHTGLKNGVALAQPNLSWPDEKKDSDSPGPQTWNIDVLIKVLQEICSNLDWKNVVADLDQPGFVVRDRQGLSLLTQALLSGLKDVTFPVDVLYRPWNNKDGQILWIQQILRNSDIFCFVDYPYHNVQLDALKAAPDESNKDICSWKSLDLLECLLQLSEAPGLYQQVTECFKFPMQHCPDILVLGLLQASGTLNNPLRRELFSNAIPVFLGSHPNAMLVLQYAWNIPVQNATVRQLILNSIAEWYLRGKDDITHLVRILEVSHDLKALSMLLNINQFPFSIDLACLASRRDYLKLEKWLTDKIKEHGEVFVRACVDFLKRRCPGITGSNLLTEPPKNAQLSPETLTTILMCLQSGGPNVSPTVSREILQLLTNCRMLLSGNPTGMNAPSAGAPGGPISMGFSGGAPGPQPQLGSIGPSPHLGAGGGLVAPSASGLGKPVMPQGAGPGPFGQDFFQGTNRMDSLLSGGGSSGGFGGMSSGPGLSEYGGHLGGSSGSSAGLGIPPLTGGRSSTVGGAAAGSAGVFSGMPSTASPLNSILRASGFATDHSGSGLLSRSSASGGFPQSIVGVDSFGTQPLAVGGPDVTSSNLMTSPTTGAPQPSASADPAIIDINRPFSDEVQEEANSYFQQIYSMPPQPTMTIDQFLDVLKRFRDSLETREQDVFACMLKNLFEEFRFFPQYPNKELYITSLLFGGIIRDGLVSAGPCIFALRAVLEALRKEPGSKMFNFGVCALDQFKSRLRLYPKYCVSIKGIPHFGQFPPSLQEFVQYGSQSQEPPSASFAVANRSDTPIIPWAGVPQQYEAQKIAMAKAAETQGSDIPGGVAMASSSGAAGAAGGNATGSQGKKAPPSLNAPDIDTLEKATDNDVFMPPENVVERIAFLFNNLSKANLSQKVEEMKSVLSDTTHLPWIAQYLVMKRASIEPNFHPLYSQLLDQFSNQQFYQLVLKETYRNIKILLRSDKSVTNFSDRTLLKNLGHWLGLITIGKNKPILHRDLDVKSLLLEAYYKGQQELLYVVPFEAKILDSCENSKVFAPPSPWTMALLNLMAELHREPDLRLNLKFEIEVLCKRLNIELSTLRPGNLLKDTDRLATLEQQLSNPVKLEKPTMAAPTGPSPLPNPGEAGSTGTTQPTAAAGTGGADSSSASSSGQSTAPAVPKFGYHDINVTTFDHFQSLVQINASLALFQLNPPLKNLVPRTIVRTVNDLLMPVADRAIRPSMTITEHIVKKDFALDPDENRMRLAAQQMIRAMTAGMAMISCREALLMMMQNNLKQTFMSQYRGASPEQQRLTEEAASAVAEDNVELAQCFITKTAVERAGPEIERRLQPDFEVRRLARAEGRRYCDPAALTFQAERMPDPIRLKVGAITPQQGRIYEEFAKSLPGFRPTTESDDSGAPNLSKHPSSATLMLSGADEPEMHYRKVLIDIEGFLAVMPQNVPQTPQVQGLRALREMLFLAAQNARDNTTALGVIQHCVEGLLEKYRRTNADDYTFKLRDAYLLTFRAITNIYPGQYLQKQVTRCLLECRSDSRYNIDAVDVLIQSQLVNMVSYDIYIAQAMESLNYQATNFAVQLVRHYFGDGPNPNSPVTETDLSNTLEQLTRLTSTNGPMRPDGSNLSQVLRALRSQVCQGPTSAGSGNASQLAATELTGGAQTAQQRHAALSMAGSDVASMLGVGGGSTGTTAPMDGTQAGNFQQIAGSMQSPVPTNFDAFRGQAPTGLPGATGASAATASQPLGPGVGGSHSTTIIPGLVGDDPPGLHEKAESILREWVSMYHSPQRERDFTFAFHAIVAQMYQNGVLKSDDLITRFFRLTTEMCVDLCYRSLLDPSASANPSMLRQRCFYTLDAYVKLIALLVRYSGDGNFQTKLNLLNKVLHIVASVLMQDHQVRATEFHQLPYHRIIIMLFIELTEPDKQGLDNIQPQILRLFSQTLHLLQPKKAPGFTFAWLDIIGHRTFIAKMLANQNPQVTQQSWGMYAQLVLDHVKFLAPFLRNIEMPRSVQYVYRGTLRILLVLLHDFPELLCEFHYVMCDVIPPNCVQLRNLILSAYPRNMRLPDPFMPNLKVDTLPEINQPPRVLGINVHQLIPEALKAELDSYLKNRAPVSFLSDLRSKLQVSQEPGNKYNVTLMNAVVLYVGMQAIQTIQSKEQCPSLTSITHTAHMDIFQNLAVDLDNEGRYLFFNAIANQLRYPNSHTHYFSCTLLYLFAEANQEAIQEQITRILFERLVAMRPHPWGLLITFIELIKNPVYKFWSHKYVRCAPEIERLFDTMAKSCMATRQPHEAP